VSRVVEETLPASWTASTEYRLGVDPHRHRATMKLTGPASLILQLVNTKMAIEQLHNSNKDC
jgi:hypothetical protein